MLDSSTNDNGTSIGDTVQTSSFSSPLSNVLECSVTSQPSASRVNRLVSHRVARNEPACVHHLFSFFEKPDGGKYCHSQSGKLKSRGRATFQDAGANGKFDWHFRRQSKRLQRETHVRHKLIHGSDCEWYHVVDIRDQPDRSVKAY